VPGLMSNGSNLISRGAIVNVYLDDMMSDAMTVSTLPVSDIAMVKFQRLGSAGARGPALLVYTKRGATSRLPFHGLPNALLRGYRSFRPFIVFDYKDDFFANIDNDVRQVLSWNSFSHSDPLKPAAIRFYNNDQGGPLRLVITGFSSDGRPVYSEQIIR
jgi:hypothetical protein